MQYSTEILDLFGAPKLSQLIRCGARALPELPNYFGPALWNWIVGLQHPDIAVLHLNLGILRRANGAAEEYRAGRDHLLRYVEGTSVREHRLGAYLSALTHFERSVVPFGKARSCSTGWSTGS